MPPLIPIWFPCVLPERTYWPAGQDALKDRYLTYQCWSRPRPMPVGVVWLEQYVSAISSN